MKTSRGQWKDKKVKNKRDFCSFLEITGGGYISTNNIDKKHEKYL